jgi:hypothetical protein
MSAALTIPHFHRSLIFESKAGANASTAWVGKISVCYSHPSLIFVCKTKTYLIGAPYLELHYVGHTNHS